MYSVFVKIILPNQVKKVVHEHQGDEDSQKVYAKLSAHALKSTKYLLNAPKLITLKSVLEMNPGEVIQKSLI